MKPSLLLAAAFAFVLPLPVQASLVALYGFEDSFYLGRNDTNPGHLDGTVNGDLVAGSSLHPGLGSHSLDLGLSGVNSPNRGLNLPDNSNILNGSRYATLSTFFSVTAIPGAGGASSFIWIGRNGNDGQVRLALQITENGGIRVIGRPIDGGNAGTANFQVGVTINTLYHIAATVDIALGNVSLYVNGAHFGSISNIAGLTAASGFFPDTDSNKAAIGSNHLGVERITGKMDDVRIYNEIISATEIADLASVAGLVPEPSTTLLAITASSLLLTRRRRPTN